ncbi:hypothetical protein [Halorubellus salinus]|uniref:hypothetical protein n=1 Tax=Halorubellus salinus TaxID=755309 RepID=UPI001D086F6B|nr:hypothetical protein [Halorubellus salinus]
MLGFGVVGFLLFFVEFDPEEDDPEGGWLLLVPLVLSIVAAGPAILVGGRPLFEYSNQVIAVTTIQLAASALALTAVVVPAIPVAARRRAWGRITDVTEATNGPGGALDDGESRLDGIGDSLPTDLPARLDVRRLDVREPAVYLFDDGRRAVLGFTDGALDALDDRERDAVVARGVVQVVERGAVPQFWASALALAVEYVLDPVATEAYDPRAGGKVRLPFWVVGPLKILVTVACLFVFFVLYVGSLSEYLPVSGLTLGLGYAIGAVVVGFGLSRTARWLASHVATTHVVTVDERGAVFAEDAAALASALRTLDDATDAYREGHEDDDGDVLGALDVLAQCPTDRVPVDERVRALDRIEDRLRDARDVAPERATANR